MATRYWVGGSGNWDATSTANWATSSGGASGASAPTSADDVIFDANSNVTTGAFTVTVTGTSVAPALCNDFSTGGAGGALDGAMTLAFGSAGVMSCFGSMTLPATNLSVTGSGTSELQWAATTSGKTITTNGVSLAALNAIRATGIGGEWTLGSALTASSVLIQSGTFNTANYNLTITNLQRTANTGTTVINLGSSTITCSATTAINFTVTTSLTFNAGTSQITCSATSPTFNGNGLTYYNVSFTSTAAGTVTITGANTFNNLTFTSLAATGVRSVIIGDNQTVSGTLTFGAANTAIRRILVSNGTTPIAAITITLNGTLATLADVDFRGIATAGTVGTWTGTRLGNGQNNSGITFDAGVNKYWNLAAGGNWSSTAWALSSGGAVAANNFPLAQDTVIIENTGLNTSATITVDTNWWWGNIDCSTRSNAYTLAWGNSDPSIYGNFTLSSAATVTSVSTPNLFFYNYNSTKTITTAGVTFPVGFGVFSYLGTVQLLDNLSIGTFTSALTTGTLDLNNNTLTCTSFNSTNSNTRAIAFGTGKIVVTGNNATVFSMSTATNFTYTGTPTVEFNYSGSTGTRIITPVATDATESNVLNIYVTTGTDTVQIGGAARFLNFDLTGFSGTLNYASNARYFGNLTFSSGMTLGSIGSTGFTFLKSSGTQTITSAGKIINNGVAKEGAGTLQLQDDLTLDSTRTFTLTNGALDVNDKTLTTGLFSSNNSNTRSIDLGTNGNITVNGGDWTATTSTNLSLLGAGTIDMTLGTAKTFAGGGATYPYTLNQGGLGTLTITGANTFTNISNTVQPTTIIFPASETTSVQNFTVSGTAGNLVTLNSSISGTQFTLALV
jgi:hypothetical protein